MGVRMLIARLSASACLELIRVRVESTRSWTAVLVGRRERVHARWRMRARAFVFAVLVAMTALGTANAKAAVNPVLSGAG